MKTVAFATGLMKLTQCSGRLVATHDADIVFLPISIAWCDYNTNSL